VLDFVQSALKQRHNGDLRMSREVQWVKKALSLASIYTLMRVVGFGLLAGYLWYSADWRVSAIWVVAFPVISLAVAGTSTVLRISERLPGLNSYLLYPVESHNPAAALSESEWALRQAKYLESGMRGGMILTTLAEDGLICVPVILLGLSPLSAIVAGIAFGCIHLARYTYLDCISKAFIYTLVCYWVLPFGILTVALGHLLMDAFGLGVLKLAKYKLSKGKRE